MLILLPPSETKTTPADTTAFSWDQLSRPDLNGQRQQILAALKAASARDDAAELLKVSPNLGDQIAANLAIGQSAAAPAAFVYTGVLFAAANLGEAPAAGLGRVAIFSGLWGVLSPADPIPAYRLSAGVTLPGIGPVARWWLPHTSAALDSAVGGELVVDCRSAHYAAMWRPPSGAATVAVRVVRATGKKRTVVSHHAKHLRGVLTGALVRADDASLPRDLDELAQFALAAGQSVGRLPTGELVRDVETTTERGVSTLTYVIAATRRRS